MINLLRAELKKIFTVRSTYFLLGFCVLMILIFAFYAEGYHLSRDVAEPSKLAGEVKSAISAVGVFVALAGALLVTYEYRYNTIMYTLTSSNSRLKVLVAKVVAVTIFSVLAILALGALSPLMTALGVHLKGLSMVPQSIPYVDLLWRGVFYGWAYAMFALLFAFIIRNQVGTIASILLVPSAVEGLLTLVLKNNVKYLPFNSLNNVINDIPPNAIQAFSHGKSAAIASIYLVIFLIVAAILFTRRDAN
jgi:ABC-2 type transport system permease protein